MYRFLTFLKFLSFNQYSLMMIGFEPLLAAPNVHVRARMNQSSHLHIGYDWDNMFAWALGIEAIVLLLFTCFYFLFCFVFPSIARGPFQHGCYNATSTYINHRGHLGSSSMEQGGKHFGRLTNALFHFPSMPSRALKVFSWEGVRMCAMCNSRHLTSFIHEHPLCSRLTSTLSSNQISLFHG